METLNWRSSSSHAKCIGTLVSILGAFVLTFYYGPPILNKPSTPSSFSLAIQLFLSPQQNWILGAFLLVITALSISSLYILQASILKEYPSKVMITCLYFLFLTIHSALISLVRVRDWDAWKIQPDITLFAILYAGCTLVFRMYFTSWCIEKEGPLYVSLFKPLAVVVATLIGVLWFGNVLYLGSIIGGVVIVVGFYTLMWGKSKDINRKEDVDERNSKSSSQTALLLQIQEEN